MNQPREKLEAIFEAALALESEAERQDYLSRACPDLKMRKEVESLLEYDWLNETLIYQPASEAVGHKILHDQDTFPVRSPVRASIAHFQILSLLGTGGMGEVWLAEDTRLGRKVAVKVLSAEFVTRPGQVRRFAQEARTASALNHLQCDPAAHGFLLLCHIDHAHAAVTDLLQQFVAADHRARSFLERLAGQPGF